MTAMRNAVLHTIFMDLHKAYNALDWYQCLNILAGYGVGTWTLCFLRMY